MTPNQEQVKSALRTFGASCGGFIGGYFAGKGWADAGTVTGILNSEVFFSLASSGILLIWGVVSKTRRNLIATVDAMPDVAGVITKPTLAGRELAKDVPSSTVVSAGTAAAESIALS